MAGFMAWLQALGAQIGLEDVSGSQYIFIMFLIIMFFFNEAKNVFTNDKHRFRTRRLS